MEKRWLLLTVVLVVLCGSTALALDPMGPPTAGLKQGQVSAGIEYSYSDMDLKAKSGKYSASHTYWFYYYGWYGPYGPFTDSGGLPSMKIKTDVHKLFANIGYGVTDNWEVFLRLGTSNADFTPEQGIGELGRKKEFHGSNGFAIGGGTKVTLYEADKLKVGALGQISWSQSDAKVSARDVDLPGDLFAWSASTELELTEIQVAIGPTYQLLEGVLIYGGPFFHFVDGELDGRFSWDTMSTSYQETGKGKASYDIQERSSFGGYLGGQINLAEDVNINVEWQHTPDADAVTAAVMWKFGP